MITARMKRTLRYCAILLVVLTPLYYVVYTLFWDDVPKDVALQTSVLYAVINMVFLGALHYVYAGKKADEQEQ